MITIHRILCPVDFSDVSRRALAHAAVLARWYGSPLTVLHAFSAPRPLVAVSQGPENIPMLPPLQPEEVEERVRTFCELLIAGGVTPTIAAAEGDPVPTIVQAIDTGAFDLVVMGTHGRGGVRRMVLGSVTERVLRTVRCPVLTVPPSVDLRHPDEPLFKSIVCAIDFGESSIRGLEYALSLSKQADARLVLLHVAEPHPEMPSVGEQSSASTFERPLQSGTLERLTGLIPAGAGDWCQPEARVAVGKPAQEILRVATETQAELIVMGVQGRGAVDLMLFGSTAHQVIRESPCPVFTLRQ